MRSMQPASSASSPLQVVFLAFADTSVDVGKHLGNCSPAIHRSPICVTGELCFLHVPKIRCTIVTITATSFGSSDENVSRAPCRSNREGEAP